MLAGQQVKSFFEFQQTGGADRRDREQEGETRGAFTGHPGEERGGDGRSRTRRAWNQRKGLRDADDQRFADVDMINLVAAVTKLFGHKQQDSNDEYVEADHNE